MHKNTRHPSGFTLVEILFGVGLMVLIVNAMYSLQRDFDATNRLLGSSIIGQQEAGRALKGMTNAIRTISISNLGSYPITQATDTSFTFFSDTNADGLKEQIRYFVSGTTLRRGSITPSGSPLTYNAANEVLQNVVEDLSNGATPVFAYYTASYDGTTSPLVSPIDLLSVRLVKVTLIIDKNGERSPIPATYTTQISLRNLKDNIE